MTVVFSGHDHVYERLKPQRGITTSSRDRRQAAGSDPSPDTAVGFDRDQAFMIVEVAADELFFETISRTGVTVDSGTIPRLARQAGTM